MALGVDTTNSLSSINWSAFYSWKGAYPTFAGRYFGGGYNYSAGEFKAAYDDTDGALTYIFPIQAAGDESNYDVEGTTGYNYGVTDATATCENLATALNDTELHVPSSGEVVVYLDVEKNITLKSAYWAGWANTVHTYTLSNSTKPFVPGIYCPYWTSSSGQMVPATSVQTVLANAYKYWTSSNVRCRGLWTSEPEPKEYCTSGANVSSAWSQFATSTQTLSTGTVEVPLYLWQYAESGVCTYTYGIADFAGGQILDLDGSDSHGGETYMFEIES